MLSTETLVVGALLFVIGAGLAYFVAVRGSRQGVSENRDLERLIAELSGGLTQVAEEGRASREALTKAVHEKLDEVSKSMGVSLKESATTTAKSVGEIQTRLKVIDEAQKNLADLSGDLSGNIVGLQNVLGNKQARGAFGEGQLKDLVSAMLPPSAYSFQTTLSNNKRADCMVLMPNPPGPIVIDAKFPLESYHALRAAETDEQTKVADRSFSADILKHVKDIADKYIIPGETADLALMFLPSEAVYAELHANYPDVVQKSFRHRVFPVSPTTLMATLNTVRAILRDAEMRKQAGVIQTEVGKLADDVVRLDKRVGKLGQHFSLAEQDIHDIQTSTRKISSKTKKIAGVQLEDQEDVEALGLDDRPLPIAAD